MTTAAHPLAAETAPRKTQADAQTLPIHGARANRHGGGRYSRFVQLTKLVSATVALVLITLVVVWPQLRSRDGSLPISVGQNGREDAESLNMINPRYTGLDENNLPYEVTADMASQQSAKSDLINLDSPKADMTMKDGSWMAMTARSGLYGQKSQELDLSGDVNLFHDSGYEFKSPSAKIDLSNGTGEGHEPTTGQGPAGDIEGEGFRFTDKGKTIVFTGKSRLVLYPQAKAAAPGSQGAAAAPTPEKKP
jgi:lipopolysaccharide export system protein LptC